MSTADEQRMQALVTRNEWIEKKISDLRREEHENQEAINALAMAAKPTYPTDAHRYGIVEASRRIRAHTPYKSHHGDPCGPEETPYAVVCTPDSHGFVSGPGHWLNVKSRGTNYGERLWQFGDSDIESLISLIEAEGFDVRDHWACDGGHSFILIEKEHKSSTYRDDTGGVSFRVQHCEEPGCDRYLGINYPSDFCKEHQA